MKRKCAKVEIKNSPPVAVITPGEKQVRQSTTIRLDASKSTDPDGHTPLKYAWRFADVPTASKAAFDDPTRVDPSFQADAPGKFIIELIVTDSEGAKSDPVTYSIEVFGAEQNEAPVANAGADQITGIGQTVQLDGSQSNDPEGDALTFQWKFKSIPDGSAASIKEPTSKTPTFIPDKNGKYIVELVVNDGLESSESDTMTVEVLKDWDLQPSLSKVEPPEGYSGTNVQVILSGNGFSEQATVSFAGKQVTTVKYNDPTTLTATLDLSDKPGEYDIVVRNPNGKESTIFKFKIKDLPPPKIDTVTPDVGISGAKYDIKIVGSGFIKGASERDSTNVLFQLVPLPTTITNDKELVFKLDLSKTLPGEYNLQLRNPGNRSSNTVKFTVLPEADAPVLSVLNPPSGGADKKIPFSVHGKGFIQGAVIVFDGKVIPSKRIRRDEVDADPVLDLTGYKEGKYKVWVRNPDGKESNKEDFEVEGKDPTPQIDRILPFFVYLNDTTTLNIYGQRFRPGLKLFLGNNEISGSNVQYKSNSFVVATVDTTKGSWQAGDVQAYVVNPNNKKSNGFKMTVTYRIPSISNVTPGGWNTKCNTDVEVYGSNFSKDAVLLFGSTKYTTTSTTHKLTRIDDKNLKFSLDATKLSATTYNIRVENGPSAKSGDFPFRLLSGSSIAKPSIREVRPAAAQADTKVSVLLYATSSSSTQRFELGAVVTLDGKVQKTTCRGTSYCYDLTAELDLTGLKPGEHKLRVVNPCNTAGDEVAFLVTEAPDPVIGQLYPPYANVGDSKIITVRGVNFSPRAKLMWGNQVIPATVKSDKEIVTNNAISFANATAGSSIDVVVDNGNGKKSPPAKFTILAQNYVPYISAVSTHEFERGKVHNGIIITGRGFTKNSVVYFNGDKVTTKYGSEFQLTADGLDFRTLKVGTYHIHVEEAGKKSNLYPVMAKPFPPPIIDRTSPTVLYENSGSTTLYIYGSRFCQTSGSSCLVNPKVVILDPNKKDISTRYSITRTYVYTTYSYVYGTFNSTGLTAGVYLFYFELPTGERSNPAPITIKPIPPPTLTSVSPTVVYDGQSVSNFYIYGSFLCPTNGSRCSSNPIVRILDDKNKDYASGYTISYSYQSTSSGSGYVRGPLNTSNMKPGSYQVEVEHPISKKKSNRMSFVVRESPPPHINYVYAGSSRYHIEVGKQQTYTLYGRDFPGSAFLRQGLNTIPLSGTSSTSRTFVYDGKNKAEGHFEMAMQGPSGKSSLPFTFTLSKVGGKPAITRVATSSSSSAYPFYPDRSYTLYVYGVNWSRSSTPTLYLDGKTFKFSSRYCYVTNSSYQYCRYYSFSTAGLKAGKHTMKYEATYSGKNYVTADYNFYIAKPPPPAITSLSPSSATHGWKGTITVYGTEFVNGAFVSIGLKTFPLRYSSTSRMYLDNFDTKLFKKGDTLKLVVVNPDGQRSSPFDFKIN